MVKRQKFILILMIFVVHSVHAQERDSLKIDTLKQDRVSIHAQLTVINQTKPSFHAKYSGDNSFIPQAENRTSVTSTLFLGLRMWKGASLFVNPEMAGGSGLSNVLGVGAAPNRETFRISDQTLKVYFARLYYRQLFALSNDKTYQSSDFNKLGEYIPRRYFSFTIGKIRVTDYFDVNKFSHDPRTQFMSWALVANGAWDFPANVRGYTPSILLEYVYDKHQLRYGISLVPLTANGNDMNWNILDANSQTLEYTYKYKINGHEGAIRILGFYTSANMGIYKQSLDINPRNPVIQDSRNYGNHKYGFGINAEQNFTDDIGGFFRASWNDGKTETWAYTEIDHSLSLGLSMTGRRWKRSNDNAGLAYVVSGISIPHQDYLKAGGKGFMLGDGDLNYTLEHLAELYYSAELVRDHVYLSGAYQLLVNPGYNRDRQGPAHIFSLRLHARI